MPTLGFKPSSQWSDVTRLLYRKNRRRSDSEEEALPGLGHDWLLVLVFSWDLSEESSDRLQTRLLNASRHSLEAAFSDVIKGIVETILAVFLLCCHVWVGPALIQS